MKIEEAIPEIRKGRRFRPRKDHRWESLESNPHFSFSGLMRCETWELEPESEPEVIEVYREGHRPWLVSEKGWNCMDMDWELSEIDDLKIAADKVRGIKDSPEYRDPKATEWYAAGAACNRPTRLDWYKKGHQAGWNAYEKARKEKS